MILAAILATGLSDAYAEELARERTARETSLRAERGWLAVAGLYWLAEGSNTIGSAKASQVCLPRGPAALGVLVRRGTSVEIRLPADSPVRVDGKSVRQFALRPDTEPPSSRVVLGGMTMSIAIRGDRVGVRLWDREAPRRLAFRGLDWYKVDPAAVVRARWVPYNPPKDIAILNILGDTRMGKSPGYAEFAWAGQTVRLQAEDAGDGLFFNFKDATSGKTTYPAGRFLDAALPKDGTVVLDFNRAVSPPCAYTDFATCPLPPEGNVLPVAIEAGEKYPYHGKPHR